jgi:acyl carrier protein
MTEQQIRTQLTGVFRDVFEDDALELRDDMTASDVESWDSLSHVNMVVAVEKTFRTKFTTKEIGALGTVGDLVALISRKLAAG